MSDEYDPIQPNRSRISAQAPLAFGHRVIAVWRSFRKVSANPILPILIIGVVAASFVFAFVLNAPTDLVFAILFIGCLTAVLETTKRHDDSGQQ